MTSRGRQEDTTTRRQTPQTAASPPLPQSPGQALGLTVYANDGYFIIIISEMQSYINMQMNLIFFF